MKESKARRVGACWGPSLCKWEKLVNWVKNWDVHQMKPNWEHFLSLGKKNPGKKKIKNLVSKLTGEH